MADAVETKAKDKKVEKKVKNEKPKKDHWFTLSGIRKEAKRVRWPKWKTEGNNPGIGSTTGEVLIFTTFFALFFVLCDFLITYLLKVLEIGA